MKKFAVAVLSLLTAVSAFAQTKTVTNTDLEKFRQQRIAAERDLKEKYAEMGTTQEEVEKQYRQRRAEMESYSDQLRIARITAENEYNAQRMARRQYESFDQQANFAYSYGSLPYFGYAPYGYAPYGYWNRSVLPHLRKLPPNMRTVQEYAIMFPTYRYGVNSSFRRFGGKFGHKFGHGFGGKFGGRPGIGIKTGFGFGRRGF